jgi:hypothetical protein
MAESTEGLSSYISRIQSILFILSNVLSSAPWNPSPLGERVRVRGSQRAIEPGSQRAIEPRPHSDHPLSPARDPLPLRIGACRVSRLYVLSCLS